MLNYVVSAAINEYLLVLFKKDYQQDDDTMLQAAIKASMEQM